MGQYCAHDVSGKLSPFITLGDHICATRLSFVKKMRSQSDFLYFGCNYRNCFSGMVTCSDWKTLRVDYNTNECIKDIAFFVHLYLTIKIQFDLTF